LKVSAEALAETAVVALSAAAGPQPPELVLLDCGGADCVTKPFQVEEVLAGVVADPRARPRQPVHGRAAAGTCLAGC
jgi:DNA-binding response OmpR family regulator